MFPLSREEIEKVSAALRLKILGAKIEGVGIPVREGSEEGFFLGEVVLNLSSARQRSALLIRLAAPTALAFQTEKHPLAQAPGAGWMQGLKKLLTGRKILECRAIPGDRALELDLSEDVQLWIGLFPVAPAGVVAERGTIVVSSDLKRFPLKQIWKAPEPAAKPGRLRPEFESDPLATLLSAWNALVPTSKRTAASKKAPPKPKTGLRFELPGEFELVVGRNAKENHEITFHLSRGRDLWLHVQGVAGAHGVVFLNENQSLPLDALMKAAEIVAHRSLPRGWQSVDVTYTPRKNVRPAPGGQPGRVLVREAKILRIKNQVTK